MTESVINDIYDVILEASLDVLDAASSYENKKQFIQDVNDNKMVSEEFFDELKNAGQHVYTEGVTDVNFSKEEADIFRFDFLLHKANIAKSNFRLANKLITIYEASQKAKYNPNKKDTTHPLGDLLIKRSDAMTSMINKGYEGKDIELGKLCTMLSNIGENKNCFINLGRIAGLGVAKDPNTHEDSNNYINIEFIMYLPKKVLVSSAYRACKYYKEHLKLSKQNKKYYIENDKKGLNPEITNALKEVDEKILPRQDNETNQEYTKRLGRQLTYLEKFCVESCFDLPNGKTDGRALNKYSFGWHMKKPYKTENASEESLKAIDMVNKLSTEKVDFTLGGNNWDAITTLGKQFHFISVKDQ